MDHMLDNAWQEQRQRLAGLAAWFDPGTVRYLEALRVDSGWRCLEEVGAGGGSIASWLCERAGPDSRVVATDLDTRFLDALTYPPLEVRRHNILTDGLLVAAFDLVHARFVVEHLAGPMAALRRMPGALAPGAGCSSRTPIRRRGWPIPPVTPPLWRSSRAGPQPTPSYAAAPQWRPMPAGARMASCARLASRRWAPKAGSLCGP